MALFDDGSGITHMHAQEICKRVSASNDRQRRWELRVQDARHLNLILCLQRACVGDHFVDAEQVCVRTSRLAQLTKNLQAVLVRPVVNDVLQKVNIRTLDWLRCEEVVLCVVQSEVVPSSTKMINAPCQVIRPDVTASFASHCCAATLARLRQTCGRKIPFYRSRRPFCDPGR